MGVKQIFIDDLREEFVKDYVFPMFRCAARGPHPGGLWAGAARARPAGLSP